ncbi:MAG: hypothetical protein ACRD0U_09285, partial [Acidimicrobiales bacterium]
MDGVETVERSARLDHRDRGRLNPRSRDPLPHHVEHIEHGAPGILGNVELLDQEKRTAGGVDHG